MPVTLTPSTRNGRHQGRPRRTLRVVLLSALAVVVVLAIAATTVTVAALSTPGTESASAKIAEWGRDHGLNWLVTWLEEIQYDADQPAVGGAPDGGIPTAAGTEPARAGTAAPLPRWRQAPPFRVRVSGRRWSR